MLLTKSFSPFLKYKRNYFSILLWLSKPILLTVVFQESLCSVSFTFPSYLSYFTYLFICLFVYLCMYLFIYLLIYLFSYSFIFSFIYLFCLFIYLFIYLFMYLFVYLPVYLFIYSNLLLVCAFVNMCYNHFRKGFFHLQQFLGHTWEVRISSLELWDHIMCFSKFLHLRSFLKMSYFTSKDETPGAVKLERKRHDILHQRNMIYIDIGYTLTLLRPNIDKKILQIRRLL